MTPNTSPRPFAKRRKVRKGTKSCWECKRRKIRCIFPSDQTATCSECQRRQVPCLTQESPMPDESLSVIKGSRHLVQRIEKVELFMQGLLDSKNSGPTTQPGKGPWQGDRATLNVEEVGRDCSTAPRTPAFPMPGVRPAIHHGDDAPPTAVLTPEARRVDSAKNAAVIRNLLAAFPSEDDTRTLIRESTTSSLYAHIINTQPHHKRRFENPRLLSEPDALSNHQSHPVILAKCMLNCAITLQTPCSEKLRGLSEPHDVIMHRLVDAATTWVTTREEMHGTIEAIVCMLYEGVFQMNCGHLRRAWGVYRRAMTAAQLMGLHRSPIPPLKRISPELDVDPNFIWFRIVYMDRYLSLLLGLPQGTSDKGAGITSSSLQHDPPLGQFERQLSVIACRILERNESSFATNDMEITHSINSDLLALSRSMPSGFWHSPNFHHLTRGCPDALMETLRVAAHVYYYGLLIQLHLPYIVHLGGNSIHESSRLTCVNASREILTRFIAHRSFNPMSACSRPGDFFALVAALTLLLAHLDAHHHQTVSNPLAYQRLSDCAMLDQAAERLNVLDKVNNDAVSKKSAGLIRKLMAIEADAAGGNRYTTTSISESDDMRGHQMEGEKLRLHIPYLGVIKIARQSSVAQEPPLADSTSLLSQLVQFENSPDEPAGVSIRGSLLGDEQHPNSTNIKYDPTLTEPLPAPARSSVDLGASEIGHFVCQCPKLGDIHGLQPQIDAVADINDWTFQGVDMAFFDSLMRGASCEEILE